MSRATHFSKRSNRIARRSLRQRRSREGASENLAASSLFCGSAGRRNESKDAATRLLSLLEAACVT